MGELEELKELLRKKHAPKGTVQVIDAAIRLCKRPILLKRQREYFRRHFDLSAATIDKVKRLALKKVKDAQELWAVLALLQAASVRTCAIRDRTLLSLMLLHISVRTGQNASAIFAYTDAFLGTEIIKAFFKNSDPNKIIINDFPHTAIDPPLDFYADLIRWNSDWESSNGYLAQADAIARLRIALGTYERDLASLRCFVLASFYEMNNTYLRARYLTTIGDAFSGLKEWQLAASMFDEVLAIESLRPGDPLHFHALIQQGICWLKRGDLSAARNATESIDPTKFQQLASLVLTIGVEYAKYLALRDRLNSTQEHRMEIRTILQKTSLLASTDPKNREEYLRTLYYRMFERDLQTLIQ